MFQFYPNLIVHTPTDNVPIGGICHAMCRPCLFYFFRGHGRFWGVPRGTVAPPIRAWCCATLKSWPRYSPGCANTCLIRAMISRAPISHRQWYGSQTIRLFFTPNHSPVVLTKYTIGNINCGVPDYSANSDYRADVSCGRHLGLIWHFIPLVDLFVFRRVRVSRALLSLWITN
jgi:hypothetical protein